MIWYLANDIINEFEILQTLKHDVRLSSDRNKQIKTLILGHMHKLSM